MLEIAAIGVCKLKYYNKLGFQTIYKKKINDTVSAEIHHIAGRKIRSVADLEHKEFRLQSSRRDAKTQYEHVLLHQVIDISLKVHQKITGPIADTRHS